MSKTKQVKTEPKRKEGRPRKYSPELAELICNLIASGKSLTSICKLDNMPCYVTVMSWLWTNSPYRDEFLNKYARAREIQAERYADEINDIADDGTNDYGFKEGDDKDGAGAKPFFIKEHVLRSRLRVDSRKWIASKLLPKKYGDSSTLQLSNPDGTPIRFSDPERAARLQHLLVIAAERSKE